MNAVALRLRPFGQVADLDLDFGHADLPGLVTSVLSQCSGDLEPAFWWAQTVGLRTSSLLRLVALSDECSELPLTALCPASACGETFQFGLPLRALPGGEPGAEPVRLELGDGRSATVRRPTGQDLRRWREARPASRAEAVALMLATLVVDGEARAEDETAVSAAIAALDPLVAFAVLCRCPSCQAPVEVPIDLETLALARLAARQRSLLREVHCLASRYGWTESQVLGVSKARRARYLALIEDES